MKVKHFRWVFAGLVALVFTGGFVLPGATMGISSEWSDGRYRFAAGTAPWALGFAVFLVSVYIVYMDAPPVAPGKPLPGLFRRFVAFWLDFALAMSIVTPVAGILPVIAEWRRTGVFEWSFERDAPAAGDLPTVMLATTFGFAALLFYYAVPVFRGRPSPGACIVGYQVVPVDGKPLTFRRALLRTLLGFVAVCGAPAAPFVRRESKQGRFWLDTMFGTRATLLD